MKSILFLFIYIFCFFVIGNQHGFAQSKEPLGVIKMEPWYPIISGIGLGLEKPVSKQLSIQLKGAFAIRKVDLWSDISGKAKGGSVELSLRYYTGNGGSFFENYTANGPYAGAVLGYTIADLHVQAEEGGNKLMDGQAYRMGLIIGWQYWIKINKAPRLSIDPFVGGVYELMDLKGRFHSTGQFGWINTRGFRIAGGLMIGVPFGSM